MDRCYPEAARVQTCFALIAAVEDTNLLHRGGSDGLGFARAAARRFLDGGGVGRPGWRDRARVVHESFVARWLSPGGLGRSARHDAVRRRLRRRDCLMVATILLALAPIFVVLAVGYVAGRLCMVDNQNVDSLNVLVMTFALPAALFVATASARRSELLDQAPLFAILGVVMLAVHLAWYLLARRFWRAPKPDAALQALTISFPNLAGVGLPIAASLLGPSGTVPVAVALASGSIIVSPAGASRGRDE